MKTPKGEPVDDPVERTYRALQMLPKELLLVLGLHHKDELSFAEIAEVLETSEDRAREMYAHAKEMLYTAGGLPKPASRWRF